MAKTKTQRSSKQPPAPSGSAPDWLEDLEEKVHAAARTIRELRDAHRDLSEENDSLRKRLDQAEESIRDLSERRADEDAGGWREERREIRDRVERITSRLEELLGEE